MLYGHDEQDAANVIAPQPLGPASAWAKVAFAVSLFVLVLVLTHPLWRF